MTIVLLHEKKKMVPAFLQVTATTDAAASNWCFKISSLSDSICLQMKLDLVSGHRLLHITQNQVNVTRRYTHEGKKYREMRTLNDRPSGEENERGKMQERSENK